MFVDMTTNLMVENVEQSIAFYGDLLGFTVVDKVPNQTGGLQFAILVKDNLSLMLQERVNLIEECPSMSVPKVQPSVTLYIRVDGFDALYQMLKDKHSIYAEVHTTFYGAKEFAVADPDGYVLTFAEAAQQ